MGKFSATEAQQNMPMPHTTITTSSNYRTQIQLATTRTTVYLVVARRMSSLATCSSSGEVGECHRGVSPVLVLIFCIGSGK